MANYQTLKAVINAVIKANGNKEITGTVLNEVLLAMVNSLGAGYQFAGVATPSTNPGTPDQKVFYIASQAGTYNNFGGAVVSDGIAIFEWNGTWATEMLDLSMAGQVQSDWTETDTTKKSYIKHKPNIPPSANVDPVPTNGSPNAVASGGVYNALKTITDFLNNGYYFVGIAGTSTVPDAVTQYGIFYIASDGGTYTNFLNGDDEPLTLYQGLNILYKDIEDDGWNYFEVFKFSDFVDTTQQQSLSTQQKAQARTNIAAVSYDAQTLSSDQQVQAQNNIVGKSYNAAAFSGLGKKVLAKNIQTVSGVEKNVLTQDMMPIATGGRTSYEVQYDYDLNGAEIQVPDGGVLDFKGGSLKNGTIRGNNFTINGNPTNNIFDDCVVKGLNLGYVDVRWFGAVADFDETNKTGTDNTEAFRRAIVACGNNTGSYVKVVGKYLIGHTIEVENDLNIKGEYLPDRTFFSSDVVTENTASLIYVPDNVTSFLAKGRGTSTRSSCNINIQNIKLVGSGSSNGSVFLESTMTGAPARVGTFSEVECKGFSKVLYFHDTGLFADGTLYGNFTIEKVVAYYNNQFIVAKTSANNIPSMCNLVIRDSNIEQNGSYVIDLEKIFGSVIIDNNILEDQANPIKVYIINGSVEITNNYFESNTGEFLFDINSQNVFNSFATIRNNYVLNNVTSKVSVRNCTILQLVQRNLTRNTHDFSSSIFANTIPESALTKDFAKVLQLPALKTAAYVDDAHPIMFSTGNVMPNGLYGSLIAGANPFTRIAYIQGVNVHQGDTMVFALYVSGSIQWGLYDENGTPIIENVDTLYLSGYCLLKYTATKDASSIGIYASSAYGDDFYICNGFLYINPDDNKAIDNYFIADRSTVYSINYVAGTDYNKVPVFTKGKNQSNMFFGDGENIRSVIAGIKERVIVVTKYVQYGTFTDANTTYFIAGEIDLNGTQVIVPAGCTLDFSLGGKIITSQAGGQLDLTGTKIVPNGCKISDYITARIAGTYAVGQCLFDETLGKPKWYDGTNWVDGSGNIIS